MHNFEELFNVPVYFIPHAANTKYFFPDKPDPKFACDIAFVGSFYAQKKEQFKTLLLPLFLKYKVKLFGTGWSIKDRILRLGSGAARRLKSRWLTKYINNLRLTITPDDERKLYASAKICINIHEYYKDGTPKNFSIEREFKVPASGGFLLSDYCAGMERYFELGKEIVTVKTPKDWFEAIEYYLKNEKERREIQRLGTERVLKEHTYRHRVAKILEIYNNL